MRAFLILLLSVSLQASPKLIAHRGASANAPENTLAAFQLAWKEGADGIEGDFRLSKDGRIVCIHDEDTHRTSGRKLLVAETPWEQLRTLDVGSWKHRKFSRERLPLIEEVLAIIPPRKYFFVEIKCGPEIVEPLAEVVRGADRKRTVFISFDPAVVAACRKRLPGFESHLISRLDKLHEPGADQTYLRVLEAIDATGLQFRHDAEVTEAFLSEVRTPGRLTACWTVDKPGTARRVALLGVDFITTNRPASLRRKTAWPVHRPTGQ